MLKAIKTVYKGYNFRSRLEARWAVFFDTLGIEYRYEMQGFDLQGKWYLPDFYLREVLVNTHSVVSMFCEIKPKYPTDLEIEKARRLALAGKACVILYGDPYPEEMGGMFFNPGYEIGKKNGDKYLQSDIATDIVEAKYEWEDTEDGFTLSNLRDLSNRQSSRYGLSPMGFIEKAKSFFEGAINPPIDLKQYRVDLFAAHNPLVMNAYRAARAARFE